MRAWRVEVVLALAVAAVAGDQVIVCAGGYVMAVAAIAYAQLVTGSHGNLRALMRRAVGKLSMAAITAAKQSL
jgi:hypothetical protein